MLAHTAAGSAAAFASTMRSSAARWASNSPSQWSRGMTWELPVMALETEEKSEQASRSRHTQGLEA